MDPAGYCGVRKNVIEENYDQRKGIVKKGTAERSLLGNCVRIVVFHPF
jgi:hypothetical protein